MSRGAVTLLAVSWPGSRYDGHWADVMLIHALFLHCAVVGERRGETRAGDSARIGFRCSRSRGGNIFVIGIKI